MTVGKEGDFTFDPAHIRARLAALRVIAGAPRTIAPRAPAPDKWRLPVRTMLPCAVFVIPAVTASTWGALRPVEAYLGYIGLGAGLMIALALQPLIKHKVRGRSDSHTTFKLGRAGSALLFPQLAIILLVVLNALGDRSPPLRHELVVSKVSYDSEDKVSTGDRTQRRRLLVAP